MNIAINAEDFRAQARKEITRKFVELLEGVRTNRGSRAVIAAQIGVRRQMLDQYASGSVPQGDVLLAALLKWDWKITVENPATDGPAWFEFGLSDLDGGLQKRNPEPVQLSLFEALSDMEEKIDTLKKSVGRVEFEVSRAFGKSA